MKNKIISDKWDYIDNAINSLPAKTQPKEVTKKQPTHIFEQFMSKDECVTCYTDKFGTVTRIIKGQPYAVHEKIYQINDYFVYTFSCRKGKILTKLPSVPNGIAINKAFFDTFSDNDKFIVEIIPNKGKDVLERYTIDKETALKEGKIKQFPGYEKQIAISLQYWKKID